MSPLVYGIAAVDRMVRMGRRGVRMGESNPRNACIQEKAHTHTHTHSSIATYTFVSNDMIIATLLPWGGGGNG